MDSDEKTASALGQLAFSTYYERQAGAALSMPDSWNMQSDGTRADWEATGVAVAARVASPTAEDYDHAAEILRLRNLVAEIISHFAATSLVGGPTKGDMVAVVGRSQVAKWHKRAGLSETALGPAGAGEASDHDGGQQ